MFVHQEHRIEAHPSIRINPRLAKAVPSAAIDTLRYNSREFIYRPEFRQLVLLDQDPKTGEKINQSPSEYSLKLYAAVESGNFSRADTVVLPSPQGVPSLNTSTQIAPSAHTPSIDISV